MDKNQGITCVVNKTNTIDSTYRNFKMEVLAGEDNMVSKVSRTMQPFHGSHIHDRFVESLLHIEITDWQLVCLFCR